MIETPRLRTATMFIAVAGATALACRAAARWAEANLGVEPLALPGVDLRLTFNDGVAFGLAGGVRSGVLIVVVSVVLAAVGFAAVTGRLLGIPAALIFGGGMANIIDRLADGVVTDYIDLGWWPVFNLPDIAITSGAILLFAMAGRPASPAHGDHLPPNRPTTSAPRSQP